MASEQDNNDDTRRKRGEQRQFRSGIFRCFAVCTLIVSVFNIAYHEAYHDENIAEMAADLFRRSHFRTHADDGRTDKLPPAIDPNSNAATGNQGTSEVAGAAALLVADNQQKKPLSSELAGLRCEDHGGPSDPSLAAEMVYWEDIPADSEWISPFHPIRTSSTQGQGGVSGGQQWEEKYLTFEPDKGGWNNIRMAMETVLVMAAGMGRTLVLPPEKGMYLLKKGQGKQKNTFTFHDFFELDSVAAEHRGFNVITMEEFLVRKKGKLYHQQTKQVMDPPRGQTNWNGKNLGELWAFLRSVSPVLSWNPKTCVAGIPASPDPADEASLKSAMEDIISEKYAPKPKPEDFIGKPSPVNATTAVRLGELLGERKEMCLYDANLQAAPVLHIMDDNKAKARLLTHSYTFLFFQDWRHDLWAKRFVRDHIRYIDEIVCAAARIVNAVRERARKRDPGNNPDGLYDSFAVRRGDFQASCSHSILHDDYYAA